MPNKPGGSSGSGSTKPAYKGPKIDAYSYGEVAYLCGYVAKRCGQTTGPYTEPNGCIVGINPNTAAQYGMSQNFPAEYPVQYPAVVAAVSSWLAWRDGSPMTPQPTPDPTPEQPPVTPPVVPPTSPTAPADASWAAVLDAFEVFAKVFLAYRGK